MGKPSRQVFLIKPEPGNFSQVMAAGHFFAMPGALVF